MVSACLDDNDVALLVDGALSAEVRDRVERHLDDCAACTELVAELARALAPDRAAPVGYRLVRALGDGFTLIAVLSLQAAVAIARGTENQAAPQLIEAVQRQYKYHAPSAIDAVASTCQTAMRHAGQRGGGGGKRSP